MCGWQEKQCESLITHGPHISALEMHRDKALYRFTLTLLYLPLSVTLHELLVNKSDI